MIVLYYLVFVSMIVFVLFTSGVVLRSYSFYIFRKNVFLPIINKYICGLEAQSTNTLLYFCID